MRATLPFILCALLTPGTLLGAQPARPDSGFQFRLFGDAVVARDAREGAVVVLQGNATIEGMVRAVVVLNGNAIIAGGRVEDLTVVHGTAQLGPGAVVSHEVHLIDADITIAEGAKVTGTIERGAGRRMARDLMGLAALVGLGVLLAVVLGGIVAAEAAPHGVRAAGDLLRTDLGRVAIAALVAWIVMPMIAVMLVPTLVGLPMGLGYFVFVLPTLWFVGLLVAGTWVGDQVLGRIRGRVEATRPWLAAMIGIATLLLLGRLPFVGAAIFILVALGGGTVALTTWRNVRGPRTTAQSSPLPAAHLPSTA
ncbi:MAG: hypothetical protein JNJ98_12980 [Gemmatimonadetes bacterium]|nr:hypothetical protein [Gemmatimonadota bacterium]